MSNTQIKTILITGANSGIGKEIARQTALLPETKKIYLGCRNTERGDAAKKELESSTGKNFFEVVKIDLADIGSLKSAASKLPEPIDAFFMIAGGLGGKTPGNLTKEGVTDIFASNILGHVALLEEMVRLKKLSGVAVLAGSEAARGVKQIRIKKPVFTNATTETFVSVANGKIFGNEKFDVMTSYAQVKYLGALWMSDLAHQHAELKFVTVSPGATQGTDVAKDMPAILRFINDKVAMPLIMPLLGLSHSLQKGAKRLIDGAYEPSLKSGHFYASAENTLTGPLVDQSEISSDFSNASYQAKATEAIHRFLS
jgi:NAD(P)-dependent dehydrogenase (short-subunit alcohol dehydrogenase family)